MSDQPRPNAPAVPSTPRTNPANTPDVPAERTSDQLDRERGENPMRTTHPGEPGKRSDR